MSEEKESEIKSQELSGDLPCGPQPTRPGLGAGDWQCRDGKWVWVEDIGG